MRWKYLSLLAITLITGTFVILRAVKSPTVSAPSTQHHTPPAKVHATSPPQPLMSLTPGVPQRITIPRLAIDAQIQSVGMTTGGEMAQPSTAQAAAWYKFGYLPGALGNAVIAGHSLYESKPAIFHSLPRLVSGDEIKISNDQGATLYFTVSGSESFPADTAPRHEIFGKSSMAQLKLITCYGQWDKSTQQYKDRYVVTAQFVHEKLLQNH